MGTLERLAVRCTLGVLEERVETDELIFCSRYGNVETLRLLLSSIAAREPMSPMAFSGSVHNAVPGLVGQICKTRLRHTAVAAGRQTFMAGLLEGYALLSSGERSNVIVTFADVALPDVYRRFDDERLPGIALAMRWGWPAISSTKRPAWVLAGQVRPSSSPNCVPVFRGSRWTYPMLKGERLMRGLERMWRLCGTAISFSLFGVGGLALALVVFPVINLVYRDRERRAEIAQRVVHLTWRGFVRTMVGLRVIDFEVDGESIAAASPER